jgi:hypothetical protein
VKSIPLIIERQSAVEFMELHKKYWPGWEGVSEIRQIFGPEDMPPKS